MNVRLLCAAGIFCALALVSGAAATAYTGSMTTPAANGVDGTGAWIDPGPFSISWEVTRGEGCWIYSYCLQAEPGSAISHFILETSTNFTQDDIWDIQVAQGSYGSIEIKNHSSSNPSNPGMPADIYGIKFDDTDGNTLEISFKSRRIPVWGDFYAKGGNKAAWNVGLAAQDPLAPRHDGPEQWHLLVPDTVEDTMIPEPGSLAALGAGLMALLGLRRRHA